MFQSNVKAIKLSNGNQIVRKYNFPLFSKREFAWPINLNFKLRNAKSWFSISDILYIQRESEVNISISRFKITMYKNGIRYYH